MSEQINVNEFKQGLTFLKNDQVYQVIESSHAKSGRGQAHVKVKAKNLFTGTTQMLTFTGGERVEKAYVERKNMQFLYLADKKAHFMDNETFDQIEISEDKIKDEIYFLVPELSVFITFFKNQLLGIEIPKTVILTVSETVDAVRGDTVTNANKKAKLETGIEIDVPQFISIGDKIFVNTEFKKYISKVSS